MFNDIDTAPSTDFYNYDLLQIFSDKIQNELNVNWTYERTRISVSYNTNSNTNSASKNVLVLVLRNDLRMKHFYQLNNRSVTFVQLEILDYVQLNYPHAFHPHKSHTPYVSYPCVSHSNLSHPHNYQPPLTRI